MHVFKAPVPSSPRFRAAPCQQFSTGMTFASSGSMCWSDSPIFTVLFHRRKIIWEYTGTSNILVGCNKFNQFCSWLFLRNYCEKRPGVSSGMNFNVTQNLMCVLWGSSSSPEKGTKRFLTIFSEQIQIHAIFPFFSFFFSCSGPDFFFSRNFFWCRKILCMFEPLKK